MTRDRTERLAWCRGRALQLLEEGDTLDFTGVVIRWTPLAPADALDIGDAA